MAKQVVGSKQVVSSKRKALFKTLRRASYGSGLMVTMLSSTLLASTNELAEASLEDLL